jgi:dihydroxyacetone kinase
MERRRSSDSSRASLGWRSSTLSPDETKDWLTGDADHHYAMRGYFGRESVGQAAPIGVRPQVTRLGLAAEPE